MAERISFYCFFVTWLGTLLTSHLTTLSVAKIIQGGTRHLTVEVAR